MKGGGEEVEEFWERWGGWDVSRSGGVGLAGTAILCGSMRTWRGRWIAARM